MNKHTPGPWMVNASTDTANCYKIEGAGLSVKVYGKDRYLPNGTTVRVLRTLANARLIAAAPDLLAACKAVRDLVEFNDVPREEIWKIIDAAVAKAEGGAA